MYEVRNIIIHHAIYTYFLSNNLNLYFSVLHDFFTQFGSTKIFVTKMHEGYGLVCHRAIKACCEAIGIKDIYAKVEGAMNIQNIIKAFFIGLLRQVCILIVKNLY